MINYNCILINISRVFMGENQANKDDFEYYVLAENKMISK